MGEIAALRCEVRGMATSIGSFDGTGDLETWLFDFESLAAHQGPEEDVAKARLLSFNLTGEAKRRFHALAPEKRTDYNAIKTCLRNTFKLTKGAKQKLKVKSYQQKHQPFESLRDFILQAEEVSSKLGLEQEDIIETIKNNTRPAARRALLGHEFASVTELPQSPFVEEEYEDNDGYTATLRCLSIHGHLRHRGWNEYLAQFACLEQCVDSPPWCCEELASWPSYISFYSARTLPSMRDGGESIVSLTHCGREDLWKWSIFNTILTSPKSWLSQEDLDAGCEHSLVPMDS